MPNISKNSLLPPVSILDGDSYSGLTEFCDRNRTISIVVISGQREALLGALQLVFGGSLNVQAEPLARDDASLAQPAEKKLAINPGQPSAFDLGLTERQLDVLALMMQGKSNKAICRVLGLAVPTVKNHVTAILRALKVSNRTEAVVAMSELAGDCQTQRKSICHRELKLAAPASNETTP